MSRIQISTQVGPRTREQADLLVSKKYGSLRDVVTIAINNLFNKEILEMSDNGMEVLAGFVAKAIERMARPGIEGWGLNNPDSELFDIIEVRAASGCTSQTCAHHSHDPAAPHFKITPRSGKLIDLGGESFPDEKGAEYYALVLDTGVVKFYELRDSRAYWNYIEEVESVPDWALAQLAADPA